MLKSRYFCVERELADLWQSLEGIEERAIGHVVMPTRGYCFDRSKRTVYSQVVCALRSLSIMGGNQTLIICVKSVIKFMIPWNWRSHNIHTLVLEVDHDFAFSRVMCIFLWIKVKCKRWWILWNSSVTLHYSCHSLQIVFHRGWLV